MFKRVAAFYIGPMQREYSSIGLLFISQWNNI